MSLLLRGEGILESPARITATLSCEAGQYALTLRSDTFVQDLWLEFGHTDGIFTRNGFSLTGEPVTVWLERITGQIPSIEDLTLMCLNDTLN